MEANTILIVEDDEACRSVTKKVLQRHYEHQTYRGKDQQWTVRVCCLFLRFRQPTCAKPLPVFGVEVTVHRDGGPFSNGVQDGLG